MNPKKPLQEQSKVRGLLIQIEIALKENRFDEALAMLGSLNVEEMTTLEIEELQAVGNLLNYIKTLAEEKKSDLLQQMKIIQTSKEYL